MAYIRETQKQVKMIKNQLDEIYDDLDEVINLMD